MVQIELAESKDQVKQKETSMSSPQVQIVKEESLKLSVPNWPLMTVFKVNGNFYVRCQNVSGYNCMSLQTGALYRSDDVVESLGLLKVK